MPTLLPRPRPAAPVAGPRWRWLRRHFGFSPAETRGFFALLLLMLATAAAPRLLRPATPAYAPAADQKLLDELVAQLKANRSSSQGPYPGSSRFPKVALVAALAPFNPNSLTAEGWEARGVPHFVARRIASYGQKAGGFKAKAQIKRIYGLEDSTYQKLAPFIELPEEAPRRLASAARSPWGGPKQDGGRPYVPKPRHLRPFDLNRADTTQLMQIRGIGRGRAKWIVRRREELGGYLAMTQLAEVFVLRDAPDLVDSLRKYTFIAPGFQPRLVHINTATFDELWTQPYIGKNLARIIVAYRNQHGPYKTPEDLRQIKFLKEADFVKLRPYVSCE